MARAKAHLKPCFLRMTLCGWLRAATARPSRRNRSSPLGARASGTALADELPESPGVDDPDVENHAHFQEVLVPGHENVGADR